MNCDIIDVNYNLKIRIMNYDKLDEVSKVSDPFLVARKIKEVLWKKCTNTLFISYQSEEVSDIPPRNKQEN